MQVFELPIETKASTGYTHKVIIERADFTSATNTQTINLMAAPAGTVIRSVAHELITPLTTSDNTLTSLAYTLGNTASAASLMDSTQVLTGATPITFKASTATSPVAINAASQNIVAAFTATIGKAINTVTAGEIHLYLIVADLTKV